MNENLPPSLTKFESELVRAVRRQLDAEPGARRVLLPLVRARAMAMIAGVGIAGAIAAAVLMLGTSATSPAYAVTRHANGTVSVRLWRLAGISGANRKLAAMDVRARIVPASALARARYIAALQPCQGKPAGTVETITINPAAIPANQELVLAADRSARLRYLAALARRIAVDTPAPTASTSGNSGSGNSGAGNSGGLTVQARPQAGQVLVYCPTNAVTGNSGSGDSGAGNSGSGNSGQG